MRAPKPVPQKPDKNGIVIRPESFAATVREAYGLIKAHAQEVGLDRHPLRFVPDLTRYAEGEKFGSVVWVTARQDAKLCGYALYLLVPSLMFKGHNLAILEAIYLTPEARRAPRVAKRLFERGEAECVKVGVSAIHFATWNRRYGPDGSRLEFDKLPMVLERLGYKPLQQSFWKFLEASNVRR